MKYFAEKKFEDGKPMLYVNGNKTAPMIYCLSDFYAADPMTAYAQKNIKAFAEKGINLVQINIFLHRTWYKRTPYNVEYVKGEMHAVLQANPNAAIIFRLHISPPYWWRRDNLDELCIFGAGGCDYVDNGEESERLIRDDAENHMRVSFASEKWKKEAGEQIKYMLDALSKTEEGKHLVGIHIACGVYAEWHQWGFFSYHPDYSKPMQNLFRRYLSEKYQNDENLQKAWKDENAHISTATLAPPETRHFDLSVPFRDNNDEYAVDSLRALQRSVTEAIHYFAKLIKENWDRPIITGVFYGYYDGWQHASVGGHLDAEYLAQSEYVDYWSAPFFYDPRVRNLGGCTVPRGFLESARLNRVLWLTEMDCCPIGTDNYIGGDPEYIDDSISILKRNVLEPFTKGMGMWYFDHRVFGGISAKLSGSIYEKNGWWETETMMNEIESLKRVCDKYALKPFECGADVLIIYDAEYLYYAPANSIMDDNFNEWIYALGKSGVAYDSIYLHDLEKVDFDKYKAVVFYNSIKVSRKTRDFIHNIVEKNGRTVVFLNACGLLGDDSFGVSEIEELSGFKVVKAPLSNVMDINKYGGRQIVAKNAFKEQFAIADSNCENVAFFDNGLVAGAKKEFSDYVAWHFMIQPSDNVFLRHFFQNAGAHVYSEGSEALLAGCGILVVSVDRACDCKIILKNGKVIEDSFDKPYTAVYDTETGEKVG